MLRGLIAAFSKKSVEKEAQQISEEVERYVAQRLGRSVRLKMGAFHTESEWDELRRTHPARLARLKKRIK